MLTRRQLLAQSGVALIASSLVSKNSMANMPDAMTANHGGPNNQDRKSYTPVHTLNGWTMPWKVNHGVKECHLIAEPITQELAPGMTANLWGYNGSSPGPTLECVEGDKLRIFVTNHLPEHHAVHWHGLILPNGMDGVSGLTQPSIKPGQTFVYEFVATKSGTYMYHPHADEMTQMAMGMMGLFIVHPKDPNQMPVDRDYAFLLNAFDIDPGSYTPRVNTMLDFNMWCWNSKVFPAIEPLVARTGDRVRIRVGNLTMTNHPIHMHGHTFFVTGTDGGWVPESARWPEVTTDVAVGQMRTIEFVAEHSGDWAIHCHKSHHTMNAMGHNVPTMIGVDQRDLVAKMTKLMPDYMAMGENGMADMAEMPMPLPDNTLPMMMGEGPFGPLEMGGMFSVVKVRDNLAVNDYRDPGWYKHPKGTVAHQWTGPTPKAPRAPFSRQAIDSGSVALKVKKSNSHHH